MEPITEGFRFMQDMIKLKWVPEILFSIEKGSARYTDILEGIPYISHTELNRKLAVLMEHDALEKIDEDMCAKYRLLPLGEELVEIFKRLMRLEALQGH